MRENGFTDTRIDEIMKDWDLIPPVQDIITMAVHEAFSDEMVATLGLDEAFPAKVAEWGKKQGLSDFWSRQYWRSHWRLPSAEMGFEMLHRGLIDDKTLRVLIKALDYSPTWHDRLIGISYNVFTRVDVRRMYQMGIINDIQLHRAHLDMGYKEEDAQRLDAWVKIEYNQEYKDITRGEIIKEFLEGIIDETTTVELLSYLGYTQDRINTMIALASYQRGYARQTARVNALKRMYLSGQMSSDEVRSDLFRYNVDPRKVEELLDLWALELKAGLRLPRVVDLNDWISRGVIDETTYRREMNRIGYSEYYTNIYFNAATAKAVSVTEKTTGG